MPSVETGRLLPHDSEAASKRLVGGLERLSPRDATEHGPGERATHACPQVSTSAPALEGECCSGYWVVVRYPSDEASRVVADSCLCVARFCSLVHNELVDTSAPRGHAKIASAAFRLTGDIWQNDTVEKIKSVAMKHIEAADVYGDEAFAPPDEAGAAEGVSLY
jgi:hypothetical protein